MTDYTSILDYLRPRATEGDIVEVGALVGNGTRILAEAFPHKKVIALDCFDIYKDAAANQDGIKMSQFYETELAGRDQEELFIRNTAGLTNVVVRKGDSTSYHHKGGAVFLTLIDGGHTPEVLKKDYKNAIKHKSAYIAFHDYNHDLPEVTKTLDELTAGMERHVLPGWLIVMP
jgi:methyltransferase family protein